MNKLLCTICALLGLALLPLNVQAATHTFKFAGIYAPDHPASHAMQTIADEVKQKTNGDVEIRVFPANQLGEYTQVYEDVMRGNIEMGCLYITGQYNPTLEISSLPSLTTSWADLGKIFTPGSFWYTTYSDAHAKVGVHLLGIYVDGFIGIGSVKGTPVEPLNPKVNHKLKIRIPNSAFYKITMDALGWDTTSINWSDAYSALQTGVVSGFVGHTAAIAFLTFGDLVKEYYPLRLYTETVSYIINDEMWKKLSPEHQKVIAEACTRQAALSIVNAEKTEEDYLQKMRDAKIKVVVPSEADVNNLAQYVRANIWPKFEKILGKEIMEGLAAAAK